MRSSFSSTTPLGRSSTTRSSSGCLDRSRRASTALFLRLPCPTPSNGSNAALWWITLGALAALGAAIYVPAAAAIFRFAPLGATELAVAAGAGLAGVAWVELLKLKGGAQ